MTLKKRPIEEREGTLAMLRDEKQKRQLEEKMTKKESGMSKVGGQQYEPNQNHEDKVKPKEGTGDARGNNNREGDQKNTG